LSLLNAVLDLVEARVPILVHQPPLESIAGPFQLETNKRQRELHQCQGAYRLVTSQGEVSANPIRTIQTCGRSLCTPVILGSVCSFGAPLCFLMLSFQPLEGQLRIQELVAPLDSFTDRKVYLQLFLDAQR